MEKKKRDLVSKLGIFLGVIVTTIGLYMVLMGFISERSTGSLAGFAIIFGIPVVIFGILLIYFEKRL